VSAWAANFDADGVQPKLASLKYLRIRDAKRRGAEAMPVGWGKRRRPRRRGHEGPSQSAVKKPHSSLLFRCELRLDGRGDGIYVRVADMGADFSSPYRNVQWPTNHCRTLDILNVTISASEPKQMAPLDIARPVGSALTRTESADESSVFSQGSAGA